MVISYFQNSYSNGEVGDNAKFARAQTQIAIEIFLMAFITGRRFVCTRQLTAFLNDVTTWVAYSTRAFLKWRGKDYHRSLSIFVGGSQANLVLKIRV